MYLCADHHIGRFGVHAGNKRLDNKLKEKCQQKWEEVYGTREEFIKRYGKSYL